MTIFEVSLPETVSQGIQKIQDVSTEVTQKAANALTETTAQTRGSLNHSLDNAVNTVVEATKFEQLTDSVANATQTAFSTFLAQQRHDFNLWLKAHPAILGIVQAINWIISHPILGLFTLLLALLSLRLVVKTLGRLVEQAFLSSLRLPLSLGKFLLVTSFKSLKSFKLNPSKGNTKSLEMLTPQLRDCHKKERLVHILARLEAIQQEQNQLLQEAATLLELEK